MTKSTEETGQSPPERPTASVLVGRFPAVVTLAALLALTWAAALGFLHHAWKDHEHAAYVLVEDQARDASARLSNILEEADQVLLDARSQSAGNDFSLILTRWTLSRGSGGIALIAPDGHVLAQSYHASTAGWPRLMTRLASAPDALAVGDPVPGKNGHPGFIPVARRVVLSDGSFGGILMYSLDSDLLSRIPPVIERRDGSLTLYDDDGVLLARTPGLRGVIGLRLTTSATIYGAGQAGAGTGREVSELDGADRFFAYRHLAGMPITVVVAAGHDAMFAEWGSLRNKVIGTSALESALILLTILFWRGRWRWEEISAQAMSVVLNDIESAVRVEYGDGSLFVANEAGRLLAKPKGALLRAEVKDPGGDVVSVTRHDLDCGGTVLIGDSVTARRAIEARIDFLTNHDPLTGLPNRWQAASRIQAMIAAKSGSSRMAALVLFDLDGFQSINDTLGHEAGDHVLTEVAGRLRDLVSGTDVVARLGGDEFLLFLDEPDDEAAVMFLSRHVPRVLARPISVRGHQVRLGASMGIAFYPRDGADAQTLFRHADIALSRAKMAGRGTAQCFDPGMMASFEEHRMMESDLRRALDSDELEICLQPQFSAETLEVTGFEALTRWQHPSRGELSPAVFIPIAERSGLINPLGLWAVEQACKCAAAWPTRHRVAVNLSPLQLRGDTIRDDIRTILRRTQFPAHLLELEVTESVLLDQDQRILETLHKLRAMDIRITLDDFGTGYSSLSYLRRFPFDKIKIDKSFIQGQGSDRGTRVILEAMIRMCCDLGFDVVAEGVETEQQLNELRRLGCQEIQGFLLGSPLRPADVEGFLTEMKRRPGSGQVQTAPAVSA